MNEKSEPTRILVFDQFLGHQVGGAQRSLHRLLESVTEPVTLLGCDMKKTFVAKGLKHEQMDVERIPVREMQRFPYIAYLLNRGRIIKRIKKAQEGLLITQGIWGAIAARFFKGKVMYFIRDEFQLNSIPVTERGFRRFLKCCYLLLQSFAIWVMFRDNERAAKKATVVISNSTFIQTELRRAYGVSSEVIYPTINVAALSQKSIPPLKDRQFISLIGSERIKGRFIIEAIARAMPDHKFLIAGREFEKKEEKGNITYMPWSKDPVGDIYNKTKLLLVPSLWREAFGRISVEAMALGIPVIGSRRGGLPEILGEENTVGNAHDIVEWVKKIEATLRENSLEQQHRLRESAHRFHEDAQVVAFSRLLKQALTNV